MTIVLFEDEHVTQLYPVSVGKPAFKISCGGFRLIDIVGMLDAPIAVRVRPHLRAVHEADHGSVAPVARRDERTILVNARMVPSAAVLERLRELIKAARPCRVDCDKNLAAALLPAGSELPPVDAPPQE